MTFQDISPQEIVSMLKDSGYTVTATPGSLKVVPAAPPEMFLDLLRQNKQAIINLLCPKITAPPDPINDLAEKVIASANRYLRAMAGTDPAETDAAGIEWRRIAGIDPGLEPEPPERRHTSQTIPGEKTPS